MNTKERKEIIAQIRTRLIAVTEHWGEQRGMPVKELMFRLRTATVHPPTEGEPDPIPFDLCPEY